MVIQLGTWTSIFLIVFGFLFAATTVALFAAIAFAIKKVQQQLEKLTTMAEPVIAKATNTLDTVQRITVNVGEKADHILTKGEALTDTVSERVGQTTTVVQETVTTPLINLSSLITGISTGLSVWSRAATNGGKKKDPAVRAEVRNNGTTAVSEERVVVTPSGR